MTDAHNLAIVKRYSGNLEALGKAVFVYDKRMVTRSLDWVFNTSENPCAIMLY
jgi:hypothetical protein